MALGSYNESLLRGASTSLDHIKNWLAGGVGTDSLPARPRIDDMDRLYVDNQDTTSGNALQVASTITTSNVVDISATALTTGKAIDLSDLSAITTGKALHIDATGITQTDGILVHVDSASTALTATGRLFLVDHTGASTVSGILAEIKSAAADETVIAQINATAALTGVALDISLAALQTGKGIDMSNLDAITTGKAIHIDATGITQTDGILVHVDSASTALTATGRLLLVDHTGAATVSGILAEIKSAAADETVIAQINATAALTGVALDISLAAMLTGKGIDMSNLDAITTGKALHIDATGITQTDGILVHVDSASTALTATGRLLLVDHTGAATVSGIIAEIKSAAADETIIAKINATGLLALGKALNISADSMTTGYGLYMTTDALTSGLALYVSSASTLLDSSGRLLFVEHTGAQTVSGVLAEIRSAADDETVLARINATAQFTGIALDISLAAMTTGTAIDIGNLGGFTTGKGLFIDATGNTQTSGILVHIDSASNLITSTGRLLLVDHTGTVTVSSVIAEIKSAASDETVIAQINATAALTGVALDISLAAMQTGKGIDMSNLDAITTGKALHIDATGITQTDGILVHVDSASTALTATGRLLLVDHTGAATVSGIIAEIKSAAADETVIAQINATAALTGVALDISLAAMQTGKGIDMSNLDAITTGKALHIDATGITQTDGILVHVDSASTVLTATGRLLLVDHTGATTTSGIIAEIITAATDETALLQLKSGATGNDLTVINTNGGALGPKVEFYHNPGTAAAADNDVIGRILFAADDEEIAQTKRTVAQIDALWTDATAASWGGRMIFYTSESTAQNEAMRILGDGSISIDLSSGAGTALVFDEHDDAQLLSQWSVSREAFLEKMCEIGVMERKESGSGILLHVQKFLMLLAGGIYQNRQRMDDKISELMAEIELLKLKVA